MNLGVPPLEYVTLGIEVPSEMVSITTAEQILQLSVARIRILNPDMTHL